MHLNYKLQGKQTKRFSVKKPDLFCVLEKNRRDTAASHCTSLTGRKDLWLALRCWIRLLRLRTLFFFLLFFSSFICHFYEFSMLDPVLTLPPPASMKLEFPAFHWVPFQRACTQLSFGRGPPCFTARSLQGGQTSEHSLLFWLPYGHKLIPTDFLLPMLGQFNTLTSHFGHVILILTSLKLQKPPAPAGVVI